MNEIAQDIQQAIDERDTEGLTILIQLGTTSTNAVAINMDTTNSSFLVTEAEDYVTHLIRMFTEYSDVAFDVVTPRILTYQQLIDTISQTLSRSISQQDIDKKTLMWAKPLLQQIRECSYLLVAEGSSMETLYVIGLE